MRRRIASDIKSSSAREDRCAAANRTEKLFHNSEKSAGAIVPAAVQAVLVGKEMGIVKAGFRLLGRERWTEKNAPLTR